MNGEPARPVPLQPWQWFPEFLEIGHKRLRGQVRLLGFALLVGIAAGLGAVLFHAACHVVAHYALGVMTGYQPQHPGGEPPLLPETQRTLVPWMLLLVPTIGGLFSGLIVFTFAPEAEGHGTDAAILSYHCQQGRIRPRVPIVKIISSALTIGTGGSGGREGPVAQIGAGIGSYLGTAFRLRVADRRILMAAGMGAGVAAIFRAPLAGALFAAEVLYRSPDFESEVIIPATLASIMAYCTFGVAFGWSPLFTLTPDVTALLTFGNPAQLGPYSLLAICMAVLAMFYTRSFYWITYQFHRLPIRPHFKPAIGAGLTAIMGVTLYYLFGRELQVLSVMSFGYGILQDGMTVAPAEESSLYFAAVLLAVSIGKILTTGLTIGSGGSGGVFGPSMVIGGCGGGALGILLHRIWPSLAPHPASFVIVGMAGFFAAAAKTPFSTLVIVSEMTGNYNLLLPTLWVCAVAFLVSDEQSIYSSQVASRSRSPAHQGDYVREVLTGLKVSQFVQPVSEVSLLHPATTLNQIVERLSATTYHALPVADSDNRLLGIVSLEEVHMAAQSSHLKAFVVAEDLMRSGESALQLDDGLDRAIEHFIESDLLALPVIDGTIDRRVLGIVRRADISSTYLRHVHGTMGRIPLN